ncbi:MAG: NAD(P)-binding protein [Polyangiaceae bacterium]|nr:NAD(P)-binding protein [Polyangiaceae bacterium]
MQVPSIKTVSRGAALHGGPGTTAGSNKTFRVKCRAGSDTSHSVKEPILTSAHAPITILGAGLTGMSAAFHLRKAGVDCHVFERLPHVGGHAITLSEQGYKFDRTGHLLHLRDPSIRELCLSWIKGGVIEIDRQSRIYSHGVYTRYPFQANTFGLPADVAYACVTDFVRAHFAAEKPPISNFEDYCRAHFGNAISDAFMIPYNTKLWGVHPREISAAWCTRFVPLPRLEDVVAGAVGKNDRELGYNARFLYPRLGIGQLSEGLAQATGSVQCNTAPLAVHAAQRTVQFASGPVGYEALISTIPLPQLVALIQDAPDHVREAALRLKCTHLYYLDVALNTRPLLPYHWIYVPETRFPFYRVGAYSNFSDAMAPPNKGCLYVELADRSEPHLAELLPKVAQNLVEMGLIVEPHAIRFARLRRIDHAYVVFDNHYESSVETIQVYLQKMRIFSHGRYGAWNYSSMEDALLYGRDAAREAAKLIASNRSCDS